METTRLSPKGQIVIPHRIRQQLGWETGLRFEVEPIEGGIALRPIKELVPTTVEEAYGCLHYQGETKSLTDMEEGIRRGARKQA